MNFLKKLALKIKKPTAIGIGGNNTKVTSQVAAKTLVKRLEGKTKAELKGNPCGLLTTEALLFRVANQPANFLFNNSRYPILIGTAAGRIPAEQNFFAAPKEQVIDMLRLARVLPQQSLMVVNYDDETVREIVEDEGVVGECLTFGLGKGADIRASDIKISAKGTSFKLNYQGRVIPVWLKNLVGKRQIYAALAVCGVGIKLGVNLVDITQTLKVFEGVLGEGQLKPGIKNSKILDDSANADPFSMDETLKALTAMQKKRADQAQSTARRIAVLGDILKVGKYSVEAHQAIGEVAAENADLLFTVGPRAKFIGNEAEIHGLGPDNIYHFASEQQAVSTLKKKIEPSDLVLVDGAAEMEMEKIVEEIRKK